MTRTQKAVAVLSVLLLASAVLVVAAFIPWRAEKVASLEPPPRLTASVSKPLPRTESLLLFGDSRVASWAPLPERPFPIHVEGFPGWTAIRLLPEFSRALTEHRPEVVMLQLGVNDAVAASVVGPARRRQALADTVAAITRMAQIARMQGTQVIVMKVVPPIRPDLKRRILFRHHVDAYVNEINRAIDAMAAQENVLVADPMNILRESNGEVPNGFRKDSLHFTPAAYAALNSLIPERVGTPA